MESIHITDSIIFGGSWNTPKIRTHFSETNRIRGWIEIMVILAEVQAEFKLIPKQNPDIFLLAKYFIYHLEFPKRFIIIFNYPPA